MTRRKLLFTTFAASFGQAYAASGASGHAPRPKLHARTVVRELQEGNLRFADGSSIHPHASPKWLQQTWRDGQHPHAVVLCCSDSRVAPEIIFDQGIGDLFVVRVAGNVANEDEIASIEYAVDHLAVPLVVVMGHSECGAVSAVVNAEPMPKNIKHLVVHINDAMRKARKHTPKHDNEALIAATVEMNVRESIDDMIGGGEVLRERVRSGALHIVGSVYHIESGKVSWL
jgi:carbonic anhydrase